MNTEQKVARAKFDHTVSNLTDHQLIAAIAAAQTMMNSTDHEIARTLRAACLGEYEARFGGRALDLFMDKCRL